MTKQSRYGLGLGVALAGLVVVGRRWLKPGKAMGAAEIDERIAGLERTLPMDEVEKPEMLRRLREFAARDDGKPVFMVNLMRYHAEVRRTPGIPDDYAGIPASANAYYEKMVMPIALRFGAQPIFTGAALPNAVAGSPEERDWDRIIVMRYPNRRAFFRLLGDPGYQCHFPFKYASLDLTLVPVRGELVLPEARQALPAGALLTFLGAMLLRRRNRED